MDQTMYEIRVAGTVPEEDLQDMGAVRFAPDQVNTVLYGVSDEAALYGLLARLRALGIDVVEVRRVADFSGSTDEPGEADRGETENA
jgi:hypothetical protein